MTTEELTKKYLEADERITRHTEQIKTCFNQIAETRDMAESVHKLANGCACTFCDGCFTGRYPVPVPEHREKFRFERKIGQT